MWRERERGNEERKGWRNGGVEGSKRWRLERRKETEREGSVYSSY